MTTIFEKWPTSEDLPLGERATLAERVIADVREAGYGIRIVGRHLEVSERLPPPLYGRVIESRVAIKLALRDEAVRAERADRGSVRKLYKPRCRIVVAPR